MPLYEHVFLARQDVSAQQVESLFENFRSILAERGGSVGKTEYWGLKSLAYRIKKNRKAHYALMDIEAPHEAVAELERQMRLSTDIIRFLTVRVDEHDPGPSPMMRRSDRDDRDGRGDRRGGRRDRDRDFAPREARSANEAPREARSEKEAEAESASKDKDKKDKPEAEGESASKDNDKKNKDEEGSQ